MAQRGDTAADAVQVGADGAKGALLSGTHLEQLATVMEGELVMVLTRTIDDKATHLGKGVG